MKENSTKEKEFQGIKINHKICKFESYYCFMSRRKLDLNFIFVT